MPVRKTTKGGKPAYQFGKGGAKYTYTPGNEASRKRAKRRAHIQGAAIEARTKRKHK